MSKPLSTIAIVHCGDEISQKLAESLINSHHPQKFSSREIIHTKDRVIVIYHYLKYLVKSQSPLVLCISPSFFDLIWKSAFKPEILKMVLNYPSKQCVHIWIDVFEEEIEKYSTGLRRNGGFRKVRWRELKDKVIEEKINFIVDKIKDTSEDSKFELNQNFSIQDFDADSSPSIEKNFEKIDIKATSPVPSASKRKKKKRNQSQNFYSQSAAKIPLHARLLKTLSYEERSKIGSLLDVGFGANWKQIARLFNLDSHEIQQIDSSKKDSPTQLLFQLLVTRQPNLSLEDLRSNCEKIMRMDVINLIDQI